MRKNGSMSQAFVLAAFVVVGSFGGWAAGAAEPAAPAPGEVKDKPFMYRTLVCDSDKGRLICPKITVSAKGTLIAVAGRGGAGDLCPNVSGFMARSTDQGRTWTSVNPSDPAFVDPHPEATVGSGSSIVADLRTGRIIRISAKIYLPKNEDAREVFFYKSVSDDDGLTWKTSDVTAQCRWEKRKDAHQVMTAHGIQLRCGRLIFAVDRYAAPAAMWALYSDDGGETWKIGEPFTWDGRNANEWSLAELSDGRLFGIGRAQAGDGGRAPQGSAYSKDRGATWTADGIVKDLDGKVGCRGAVALLTDSREYDRDRLVYCHALGRFAEGLAGQGTNRQRFGVQVSYDNGKTWTEPAVIQDAGNAGHSDIVVLPDKTVGCLYEGRMDNKSEGYSQLVFARCNLEWITGGKDKIVPKAKPGAAGETPAARGKRKE